LVLVCGCFSVLISIIYYFRDFVSDFDLMMERKKAEQRKQRRKKKNEEFINDNDDLIADMICKMKEAAEVIVEEHLLPFLTLILFTATY
jgi:ribose 5-phosphate isomerase